MVWTITKSWKVYEEFKGFCRDVWPKEEGCMPSQMFVLVNNLRTQGYVTRNLSHVATSVGGSLSDPTRARHLVDWIKFGADVGLMGPTGHTHERAETHLHLFEQRAVVVHGVPLVPTAKATGAIVPSAVRAWINDALKQGCSTRLRKSIGQALSRQRMLENGVLSQSLVNAIHSMIAQLHPAEEFVVYQVASTKGLRFVLVRGQAFISSVKTEVAA